jgi:hypothetical protein
VGLLSPALSSEAEERENYFGMHLPRVARSSQPYHLSSLQDFKVSSLREEELRSSRRY